MVKPKILAVISVIAVLFIFGYTQWQTSWHQNINEYPIPRSTKSYIEKRFEIRLRTLRTTCKKQSDNRGLKGKAFGFYTVPKKRLFLCEVPKSGTSTWILFFWNVQRALGGVKNVPYNHKYLKGYRASGMKWLEEIKNKALKDEDENYDNYFQRLNSSSYHRAIMARHPFGRLISGWNDKFRTGHFQNGFFKNTKGLKEYIKYHSSTHLISWRDFAKFVSEKGVSFNIHFKQNYEITKPCQYNFNYVVKTETMDEDKQWLTKKWGLSNFTIGHANEASLKNDNLKHQPAAENIENMMKLLPRDVVKKLYDIFDLDFQLYGYTFDIDTMKAGGFD